MDDVIVTFVEEPELNSPILIEGLPGVGNVGKLAAEHLIDELKAQKFADIFSKHFPPQVLVNDDGTIKLVNNEMFYVKGKGKSPDIVFLVGDYQGLTPEGQYNLTDTVIAWCLSVGVTRIYTLGGYGLGKMVKEPKVMGATTTSELVEEMKEAGVSFKKGEPGSGIVGASGLLLGLGRLVGIEGVCLMGETSGYFVDPKSAQAVLTVLTNILGVKIDFAELESKAEQVEKLTSQIKEMEQSLQDPPSDDLQYIG